MNKDSKKIFQLYKENHDDESAKNLTEYYKLQNFLEKWGGWIVTKTNNSSSNGRSPIKVGINKQWITNYNPSDKKLEFVASHSTPQYKPFDPNIGFEVYDENKQSIYYISRWEVDYEKSFKVNDFKDPQDIQIAKDLLDI